MSGVEMYSRLNETKFAARLGVEGREQASTVVVIEVNAVQHGQVREAVMSGLLCCQPRRRDHVVRFSIKSLPVLTFPDNNSLVLPAGERSEVPCSVCEQNM